MKKYLNMLNINRNLLCILLALSVYSGPLIAQDPQADTPEENKAKPVKNTFGSVWLIDNQTVIVPVKGTLEFDIHHRFGNVKNGAEDVFGLFAPSNIRLGLNYAPIKNLFVGAGLTKERMQVDLNAKYAILHQTPGSMPLSVSYYGNMVIDARKGENFREDVHRFSYFHQLIIARKITENFSAQVAPSLSWFNNVEAYVNTEGEIKNKMENNHLAISVLGRYKISGKSAIIAGYDQPLTEHVTNNPHPNICFGLETTTSSHAFQIFAGNYFDIVPQSNNMYNGNDFTDGQFLIGFNITRLWNF